MKNKIIITLMLLFLMSICSKIYAKNFPSKDSLADTDFYGQIDTIYPDELRVIIDDISYYYSNKSLFLDLNGNTVINIDRSIEPDLYVKYHISPISNSSFFIIDLKVISENEYNNAEEEVRANTH
jgi:hypothetical protein